MYYMIDSLIKENNSVYINLFENKIRNEFVKDFKDSILKEDNELAKKYLILFLTWDGYFSSDFQNKAVDKLYTESRST